MGMAYTGSKIHGGSCTFFYFKFKKYVQSFKKIKVKFLYNNKFSLNFASVLLNSKKKTLTPKRYH
jgi:hypothetical protein